MEYSTKITGVILAAGKGRIKDIVEATINYTQEIRKYIWNQTD